MLHKAISGLYQLILSWQKRTHFLSELNELVENNDMFLPTQNELIQPYNITLPGVQLHIAIVRVCYI